MFSYSVSHSYYDYYPAQYFINAHNERMSSACNWSCAAPVSYVVDEYWAATIKTNLQTTRAAIAQLEQHQNDLERDKCIDSRIGTSSVPLAEALLTDCPEPRNADTQSTAFSEAVIVVDLVEKNCDEQQPHFVDWKPAHTDKRDEPCEVDKVLTTDCVDSGVVVRVVDEPKYTLGQLGCNQLKQLIPTTVSTVELRSRSVLRMTIGTTTMKDEQCLTRWLGLGSLRLLYDVQKLYFVQSGLLWTFAVFGNYASFSNTFGTLVEAAGGDVTAQRSTQENPLQLNPPLRLDHWTVCSNRTVSSRRLRDAVLTANPATFYNK